MSIADQIKIFLPAAETVASVALGIAKVMPGAGNIISAIELGVKVANGIANAIPAAEKAWADIQAVGKPVSEDQWIAWQADVDGAHADFLASVAHARAAAGS